MSRRQWVSPTIAAMLLLARGGAAAPLEVDAGALRARLETDPSRILFLGTDGGTVLGEATDRTVSPAGPLGFRTSAGWFHATRFLGVRHRGGTLVATAETNDPVGRRFAIAVSRDGEGVVALVARTGQGA